MMGVLSLLSTLMWIYLGGHVFMALWDQYVGHGTVRRIFEKLSVKGLLYRYPPDQGYDGVSGDEHLFAICNFWAVDCLVRQGRVDDAMLLYERLLAMRNHVGLYAEEFRVDDGAAIGNFPQAFSHVGLITAGLSIGRALGTTPAGSA